MTSRQSRNLPGATACYVYGVLSASANLDLHKLVPMGAFPLECVRSGRLQALVDTVSKEEFNDDAIQECDLRWIAEKAQHHDEVARLAAAEAPFIPFRFCTVLKDESSVLKLLASNEEAFLEALAKLNGKSEWGVRITRSGNKRDAVGAEKQKQDAQSGKAYLLRKQRHLREKEQTEQKARSYAEACHKELEQLACATARLPANRYGSMSSAHDVFSASYLIADNHAQSFKRRVSKLTEKYSPLGINLHLTGPWPAYSFTNLELSFTRASA